MIETSKGELRRDFWGCVCTRLQKRTFLSDCEFGMADLDNETRVGGFKTRQGDCKWKEKVQKEFLRVPCL